MEDRLIPFEAAILAKEKGFNIIQRYGTESSLYDKDGKHVYYSNYGFMYSGLSDGYISAPTQTLLQKWLREEHNVIVLVDVFLGKFICKVNNIIVTNNRTGDILKYDTYEKALEIGLIEGLNRI